MVQDAERFILSNRTIIEQAPLQTYASALVFSPTESLTRKCYSDQLPAWLVRLPTVQENWDNNSQTPGGHRGTITAIVFSPDGKYLAAGSCDCTVRLWDPATGTLHSTLKGHSEAILGVAFSKQGLVASASMDSTVLLWDPVTGVASRILKSNLHLAKDHREKLFRISLSFLPNGDLVVEFCSDRSVVIWNRQEDSLSKLFLQGFTIHHLLVVSSQGRLALEAYRKDSNKAEVLLYNSTTGAMQSLDVGSPDKLCEAAFFSEDELALGFSNGTIEVRDSAKGSYKKLEGHSKKVEALSFPLMEDYLSQARPTRLYVDGSFQSTHRVWLGLTQRTSCQWHFRPTASESPPVTNSLIYYNYGNPLPELE